MRTHLFMAAAAASVLLTSAAFAANSAGGIPHETRRAGDHLEVRGTHRENHDIARILQDEGYIQGFKLLEEDAAKSKPTRMLRLFLKYGPHGEKVITGIERISRPGRRVYFGVEDVPTVLGGLGTSILTTSRGVMTGRAARKAGVGGEVLCNVW